MQLNKERLKTLKITGALLAVCLAVIPAVPAVAAPQIEISPVSGSIGTVISVTGSNFQSYAGDSLSVYFDNAEVAGSPFVVPADGSFTFEITVPEETVPGEYDIRIRGAAGSTLARSTFTVPPIQISASPPQGTVGTMVTVVGSGFRSGGLITVYYFNRLEETIGTVLADDSGAFTYSFTLPASIAGEHEITASNAAGQSATTEILMLPTVELSRDAGPPGDTLTITGHGFATRADITIHFNSRIVATSRCDSFGSFIATFNLPQASPELYEIRVVDEQGNPAKSSFTITAGAVLSQTEGSVGSRITITGSGFSPGSAVEVFFDGDSRSTDITDNKGSFALTVTVPPGPAGTHVFTASDSAHTIEMPFVVEGNAPPEPLPILPLNGSETGPATYFDWTDAADASQPVTYQLQVAADANFTSIVLSKTGLPDSEHTLAEGEELPAQGGVTTYYWRVRAVDAATNRSGWTSPWSYVVAAPEPPALVEPAAAERTSSQFTFDWKDVASTNAPVTYTLQVAADADYSVILFEKTGIMVSEYTLTDAEALDTVEKDTPYYWRVKVVDSVASASTWSESLPFHVGFTFKPPGWVVYLLIGIGAVVLGLVAFWYGRRTAFFDDEMRY